MMVDMNNQRFLEYKAAADRIRRGEAIDGDEAICDAYDRDQRAPVKVRSWYDLPAAANAWRSDARRIER